MTEVLIRQADGEAPIAEIWVTLRQAALKGKEVVKRMTLIEGMGSQLGSYPYPDCEF